MISLRGLLLLLHLRILPVQYGKNLDKIVTHEKMLRDEPFEMITIEDVRDRKDFYEVILHMRKRDLEKEIACIESTEAKNTEKVQPPLLDAIKNSKSSDKTWIQILYEIYCPNLYIYVSVLNLALLVAVAVKYVSLIHISLFTVLEAISILSLLFDYAFSVIRQYFKKVAEQNRLISKHSQRCYSRSENFLMRNLNEAINGDSCLELENAMLIDPVFEVSLSKALSDSLSGAIVGAVETLGISIQSFLASFSWYYLPLVLPCVVLIIVISVCGYLGIRIRLPFNIAAFEIGHRIQLPHLVVPQNNPAIDNDKRPQIVGSDANPVDQNQNVRTKCETAQCPNAGSVNCNLQIDDSSRVDCSEDPSLSQDSQYDSVVDASIHIQMHPVDLLTDRDSHDSAGFVFNDVGLEEVQSTPHLPDDWALEDMPRTYWQDKPEYQNVQTQTTYWQDKPEYQNVETQTTNEKIKTD